MFRYMQRTQLSIIDINTNNPKINTNYRCKYIEFILHRLKLAIDLVLETCA